MELEEVLYTYLQTQSSLTALIGTRIYPDKIEGQLPSVFYLRGVDDITNTLQGKDKLTGARIQYSAAAETKSSARTIRKLIETALTDYHGTLSGVVIQATILINRTYGTTFTEDGKKAYVEDVEYEIWYEE